MDGIMSGVIGVAALAQLGFSVELYVPDPSAGYGFDERTIDDLMHKHPKTAAILTCDTGIGCRAGVIHAKRRYGVRVLVTDHHVENVASTTADVADACVDPCRVSDPYPMKAICGAHVMWKVMCRYAETYRPLEVERIHLLRVFAGLGTISDMMDLAHENRQLVRDAVSVCRLLWSFDWYREMVVTGACPSFRLAFDGLIAVLRVWTEKVDDDDKGHKISRSRDIDENFFGYYVAPMFNAAKRLDLDMLWPFGLFMGWYGSCCDAFGVAKYLYVANNSRKDTVQLYLQRLHESEAAGAQPFAPYAYVYDNDSAKSGNKPTVFFRKNHSETLVCMRLSDWIELYREWAVGNLPFAEGDRECQNNDTIG
jgi:single-stranded-DNA-specific exonuclease